MSDRRTVTYLLVAVATVATVGRVTTQTGPVVITHVNVVDVLDGRILPDRTVAIDGGTITSVTQNPASPAGARVVNGRDRYLIPGLWDMHAHMEATRESSLQLYVANGVTGIRDMGSDLDFILGMRDATAAGRVLGPRIFAAGPILDDAPGDWPYRLRVKTADEGRAAVQLLKRRRVDLIKVHDNTPRDVYFAIADEARRQKLRVAGHIPRGLTAEQVIEAGQTDIEHLSNLSLWRGCSNGAEYRPDPCHPFFEMLARRGIWQTPTLAAGSEIATIGTPASEIGADRMVYAARTLREMWAGNQRLFATPEAIRSLRAGAVVAAVVTRDLASAGVGILAGCDSMIPGFCVHDELVAMVRGGMPPLKALQTATLNPARYFDLQDMYGSVAAGKVADLVLLDANPLEEIGNIRRIRAVIVLGRLFERKELDRLLAEVRRSAAQQ
jgi:imidazolonepropionase-like amidohydrolase